MTPSHQCTLIQSVFLGFVPDLSLSIIEAQIGLAAAGEFFHVRNIVHRLQLIYLVLLFYDWALNLPTEISEIWSSTITIASALYIAIRYGAMLSWIFQIADAFIYGSPVVSLNIIAQFGYFLIFRQL